MMNSLELPQFEDSYDSVILYDGSTVDSPEIAYYDRPDNSVYMSYGSTVLVIYQSHENLGQFSLSWKFVGGGGEQGTSVSAIMAVLKGSIGFPTSHNTKI